MVHFGAVILTGHFGGLAHGVLGRLDHFSGEPGRKGVGGGKIIKRGCQKGLAPFL